MEKTHSVFITVDGDDLEKIIHNFCKAKGLLKDVPFRAEKRLFNQAEVTLEYTWDEDIK